MGYVVCAGEALIDFISKNSGKGLKDSQEFEKRAGGSPMNVAVGVGKLGGHVKFLGKISMDEFGDFLVEFLEESGVETDMVIRDPLSKTTLAFVALDENGKPSFEFYGGDTADAKLRFEEVEKFDFEGVSLFHFGSISLLFEPTASTIERIFYSLPKHVKTSFDPNIRKNLIDDKERYLRRIERIFEKVDIVKLSLDDMEFITGSSNPEDFIVRYERWNKITVITKGSEGSLGYFMQEVVEKKAWTPGEVVDTTGCGDAYMAGLIYTFSKHSEFSLKVLEEAMEYGTVMAGIVATRYGAASAMPSRDEMERYLLEIRRR